MRTTSSERMVFILLIIFCIISTNKLQCRPMDMELLMDERIGDTDSSSSVPCTNRWNRGVLCPPTTPLDVSKAKKIRTYNWFPLFFIFRSEAVLKGWQECEGECEGNFLVLFLKRSVFLVSYTCICRLYRSGKANSNHTMLNWIHRIPRIGFLGSSGLGGYFQPQILQ